MLFGGVIRPTLKWGPHSEVVIAELNNPLLTSAERLSLVGGLESAGRAEFSLDPAGGGVLLRIRMRRKPATKSLIPQNYGTAANPVKRKSPTLRRGFHLAAQVGGFANVLSCVSCKRI